MRYQIKMADGAASASVSQQIGRYDVVGRLATGGMAEILLGRIVGPSGFERPVVIKRILPHLVESKGFVEMFVDEARIVAGIRHPNVVHVQELGQHDDALYLVMEYLEGESLGGVLRRVSDRGDVVAPAIAAVVIADACAGLHAAHELTDKEGHPQNLVHRDVSPQNLFITYGGQVKVIDFGIATAADRIARTEVGQIKGKSAYMSPEQCIGAQLDRRSDVFALGIVLFELATTRRLFARDNQMLTFKAICEEPIPAIRDLLPDFPQGIDAVCRRALARDPAKRYSTARAMRRELMAAMRELALDGEPDEAVAELMEDLFAERRDEKRDLLEQVQLGTAIAHIPDAETDVGVTIPVAQMTAAASPRGMVGEPAARQRSRGWIMAAALVVGALASVMLIRPWTQAPAEPSTAPVATGTAPTMVELTIGSDPPGATARIDGQIVGVTPTAATLQVDSSPSQLELTKNGFEPHAMTVTPDANQRLVVTLRPLAPVPAAASAAPSATAGAVPPPAPQLLPQPKLLPDTPPSSADDDGFHRFD